MYIQIAYRRTINRKSLQSNPGMFRELSNNNYDFRFSAPPQQQQHITTTTTNSRCPPVRRLSVATMLKLANNSHVASLHYSFLVNGIASHFYLHPGAQTVCVSSGIFPFHSFSVVASAFNSVKCYSRIFLQDNLLLEGHILFPWLSIYTF